MSIPAFLAACAGLALGGFDPAPLLIAAVFMAARPERNRSPWGLFAVALGFVAIVTTDPPFIVAVGLSGEQPLWAVLAGQTLWAVVSQAPLFALCLAVLANRHRALAAVVGGWWARARPWVNALLPAAVAVLGLALISDAAEFFLLGRFMIDPRGVL